MSAAILCAAVLHMVALTRPLFTAGALLMFWFVWCDVCAHRVDRETERE
jgi:hypothetical protein